MENASKALLIAGGVLLVVLVLSFATLLFGRLGAQTSDFYSDMSDTEIYIFNQQFFNYEGDINIHDVVSIINLAKDSNKRGNVPVIIEVKLNGSDLDLETMDKAEIGRMLSDDLKNGKEIYHCSVDYANKSNYVGIITINKK